MAFTPPEMTSNDDDDGPEDDMLNLESYWRDIMFDLNKVL